MRICSQLLAGGYYKMLENSSVWSNWRFIVAMLVTAGAFLGIVVILWQAWAQVAILHSSSRRRVYRSPAVDQRDVRPVIDAVEDLQYRIATSQAALAMEIGCGGAQMLLLPPPSSPPLLVTNSRLEETN